MAKKPETEEYIEQLWYMKEEAKTSVDALVKAMNGAFDQKILDQLFCDGLIKFEPDPEHIILTDDGLASAKRLIRAHRIAERLLNDAMGGDFELGACEFEHTVNSELVDSICTLLGHPKECPHGMPIPEGECCKRHAKTALCFVKQLSELAPGESARIAYINCSNDQLMHKLEGLCLRPGALVKVHQNYPTYVIECQEASIALDKEVVSSICVWNSPVCGVEPETKENKESKKTGRSGLEKIFRYFSRK